MLPVKVSLVATVLNDLESCKLFMQQMLRQNRRPDEIVIVDAGSKDGTWEWMQEMTKSSLIPFVAHQETKCNVARGRNLAIERSRHDIIVSTDLGNEWSPEWLEELVIPLEQQPDCQAVMGSWEVRYADLKGDWAKTEYAISNGLRFVATPQSDASSRAISYRKSLWQKIGGYPEDLTFSGDDLAYSFLLHRTTDKIACAPIPRCFWERHEKLKAFCKESRRYQRGTAEAGLSLNYGVLVGGRLLVEALCAVLGLVLVTTPSTRLVGGGLCLMALASVVLRLRRVLPAAKRAQGLGVSQPFRRVLVFEYLIRYWGVVGYWEGFFGGRHKCAKCRNRIRQAGVGWW